MQQLFANNTASTLAVAATAQQTTIQLAAGTGSRFPAPDAGQFFVLTLTDANTRMLNEVAWVTAINGDVLTVERGQEGTAALAWNAGDIAQMLWTAGGANGMLQGTGNLDGLASAAASRDNLGLGNASTADFGTTPNTVADGGALAALTAQVNQTPVPGLPAIAAALGYGILNYASPRTTIVYYMGGL